MEIRGNQQERQYDYAWLAGIIDGEGSITFQTYIAKPYNTLRILPFICIVNSNQKILDKCKRILDEICTARIISRKPDSKDNTSSFKNRKPCYQIRVDGSKALTALLPLIKPFLTGKLEQAQNIEKFISSRKDNLIERDNKGKIHRISYTDNEINLMINTKSLNRNESPTTIRLALQAAGKI